MREGLSHSSSAVVIAYQPVVRFGSNMSYVRESQRPRALLRTSRGRLGWRTIGGCINVRRSRRRKEKKRAIIISVTRERKRKERERMSVYQPQGDERGNASRVGGGEGRTARPRRRGREQREREIGDRWERKKEREKSDRNGEYVSLGPLHE